MLKPLKMHRTRVQNINKAENQSDVHKMSHGRAELTCRISNKTSKFGTSPVDLFCLIMCSKLTFLFFVFNSLSIVTTRHMLTVTTNTSRRGRPNRKIEINNSRSKDEDVHYNIAGNIKLRLSDNRSNLPKKIVNRVRRQLLFRPYIPDPIRYENKLRLSVERLEEPQESLDNLQLLLQNGPFGFPWLTPNELNWETMLAEMLNQESLSQNYLSPDELTFDSKNSESETDNVEPLEPTLHPRKPAQLEAAQNILFFSSKDNDEHPMDQLIVPSDLGCVSVCDSESDVIASVDTTSGNVVFCDDKNYESVGKIQIFDTVTSQQSTSSSLFAIIRQNDTVINSNITWNMTASDKTIIHLNSSRVFDDSGYEIFELSLGDLPKTLVTGDYHVTSSVGGQGTVRVFKVVCYESVTPMSRTLDIQVLCKALGALDGDVTFTWEIPTADGDIVTVSNSSSESGYHVEEYLMGKFPISVLSIPPHAQHASRIKLMCHATTKCGCRATGEEILVIWDLKPHHNITKQGHEGFVSVTILGSDVSWPHSVFQMSRNRDRKLMSDGMVGYKTLQQVR